MKHMEIESKCTTREGVKQNLHKRIKRRPMYLANLGQAPTKQEPRPTQEPTCTRRWRGRPAGPPSAWLSPPLLWQLHGGMLRWYRIVSYFTMHQTDLNIYKYKVQVLFSNTHQTRAYIPPLVSVTIFSCCIWSKARSFIGELVLWRILGMNNIKDSSMCLLSYYHYSYAYEIELSSYVIRLAYRTLCLILHTTYMFRPRAKLR